MDIILDFDIERYIDHNGISRFLSIETNSNLKGTTTNSVAKTIISKAISDKWKKIFWEKSSVDPAMLRVPLIILFFLFLWGINVWLLDKSRIQYHSALRYSVNISMVFYTSMILMGLYILTMTTFSSTFSLDVETGISLFYFTLFLLSVLPFSIPGSEYRIQFYRLLKIVFFPTNVITFPEVLLADALTSMARTFKDITVTILVLYCHFMNENIIHYHDFGILSIAILTSLPYWIRVRQCSVQFMGAPDNWHKLPVFLNIMKYCSSFPPIWLAASQGLGYTHPYLITVITFAAFINSIYSYAWDISMDWGLITFTRTGSFYTRQRYFYHPIWYIIASTINLILRFSWKAPSIPLFGNLHSANLIILLEVFEVCRRAMWNMLRIEWEVICQQDKLASSKEKDDVMGGRDHTSLLLSHHSTSHGNTINNNTSSVENLLNGNNSNHTSNGNNGNIIGSAVNLKS